MDLPKNLQDPVMQPMDAIFSNCLSSAPSDQTFLFHHSAHYDIHYDFLHYDFKYLHYDFKYPSTMILIPCTMILILSHIYDLQSVRHSKQRLRACVPVGK